MLTVQGSLAEDSKIQAKRKKTEVRTEHEEKQYIEDGHNSHAIVRISTATGSLPCDDDDQEPR